MDTSPWVQLGIAGVAALGLAGFFAKKIWPFIIARIERAEQQVDKANTQVEKANVHVREQGAHFVEALRELKESLNSRDEEFIRTLDEITKTSRASRLATKHAGKKQ